MHYRYMFANLPLSSLGEIRVISYVYFILTILSAILTRLIRMHMLPNDQVIRNDYWDKYCEFFDYRTQVRFSESGI